MDSTFDFGALIIEAGASGGLGKLKVIRRRVNDDIEFQKICDEYRDFSTGQNVLHYAAEMGHLEICKFLIKNVEVHIDASTYKRDTPLMLAAKEERIKIVEYLINQGAEVNLSNSKGLTALYYAVLKDNRELMTLLLLSGAFINADSVYGTSLQCATSHGNVEAVKFLLSHGAQPNFCFLVLESPLVCAIKSDSFECMDALLKGQANPNRFFYGLSPLSYAAKEGDTKYLKSLLEAGANLNLSAIGFVRPIETAALAHNREGVEILFPLTERLQHIPKWTVDGIMEYCHSEEAKKMREEKRIRRVASLDVSGQAAVSSKMYSVANGYYIIANNLDPSNPTWASKRSLCLAHSGRRVHAMIDVEKCLRLNTHGPDPHREDAAAAAMLFKKFLMAGLAFVMDPHNKETGAAYKVALFDHFASIYLMSSPTEIVSFSLPCTGTNVAALDPIAS